MVILILFKVEVYFKKLKIIFLKVYMVDVIKNINILNLNIYFYLVEKVN